MSYIAAYATIQAALTKPIIYLLAIFYCRFMILEDAAADMIGAVEAALIRSYYPLWNSTIDGFGNHDPESGIHHRAFLEWNKDACKTLKKNFGESLVYEGDIREFDFSDCNGVDILAGGPPCQPFSLG